SGFVFDIIDFIIVKPKILLFFIKTIIFYVSNNFIA
ncbi:unnamed protein product, partial [marine sediment metagenome]